MVSDGQKLNSTDYDTSLLVVKLFIYLKREKRTESLKTEKLTGPAEAFLTRGLYFGIWLISFLSWLV